MYLYQRKWLIPFLLPLMARRHFKCRVPFYTISTYDKLSDKYCLIQYRHTLSIDLHCIEIFYFRFDINVHEMMFQTNQNDGKHVACVA